MSGRSLMYTMMLVGCGALSGACATSTGVDGAVADVRGTWEFTGDQSAPALQLAGTLVIESQDGDLVTGSLSWEERDGQGAVLSKAGAVTGRVIGQDDIDFDVFAADGVRRHVARLSFVEAQGTMDGAWVQVATGKSGQFTATRTDP